LDLVVLKITSAWPEAEGINARFGKRESAHEMRSRSSGLQVELERGGSTRQRWGVGCTFEEGRFENLKGLIRGVSERRHKLIPLLHERSHVAQSSAVEGDVALQDFSSLLGRKIRKSRSQLQK
jgi:hypothetical protein